MMSMIIWGILFFALIIIESATAQLVSIWFALGSLAAFITTLCVDSFLIEFAVFVFVSLLFLIVTRPLLKKFIKKKPEPTNLDGIIGQEAIVIEEIDNLHNQGRIMHNGLSWNARTQTDETAIIAKNSKVLITKIQGCTAFVKQTY